MQSNVTHVEGVESAYSAPQYRAIQSNVTHVKGVKSGVCDCIQINVTHVRGVKSELSHILCTALYEQNIKGYVKGVKRDSKYTIRAIMLCMSKVSKEAQNTL